MRAPHFRNLKATLMGRDPRLARQVWAVLFSGATYVAYASLLWLQVAFGFTPAAPAAAVTALMIAVNGAFFALVRSGAVARGRDPGLARTQLFVGMLFLYVGYALSGPAAPALTIVIASHIVYSMFTMSPAQVWRLVVAALLGLAATQLLCHALWPLRYPLAEQLMVLLYASLVIPTIALLAHRVTAMAEKLRSQRAELAGALARVQQLATRDELTGAHNRRHMQALLDAQCEQHRRSGEPLALALVDLDHFKAVNDGHGHAAGDAVLRHVAAQLQSGLRTSDLLGRWGGEEFLIALPATPRECALATLERLQHALGEPAPALPAGLRLGFSAGVTVLAAGEPLDAAIERADQAMYRAKAEGRARSIAA